MSRHRGSQYEHQNRKITYKKYYYYFYTLQEEYERSPDAIQNWGALYTIANWITADSCLCLRSRLFDYGINVGGQKYFDICSVLNSAFKIEVACTSETLSPPTSLHGVVIETTVTLNLTAIKTSTFTTVALWIAPESCLCGRWFLPQIVICSWEGLYFWLYVKV
jgi:hypothetical protein